jgi:PAS domain S-box-containing protein
LSDTGARTVGRLPWGTHCCHFYETSGDLFVTLIPYFKTGLEDGEFCLWVVSEPEADAWSALRQTIPALDRYVADGSIELIPGRQWYVKGQETFDSERLTARWHEKLGLALDRGYAGMRASGDASGLEPREWQGFIEYERHLHASVENRLMTIVCAYPLIGMGGADLLDVMRAHRFGMTARGGTWRVVDTTLEPREADRTRELEAANDELRRGILEKARLHESLAENEARLRLMVDAIPHQVRGCRPDGTVDYCNRRWLDYTGVTLEEAQHGGWKSCLHPDDVERVMNAWHDARSRGEPCEIEQRVRGVDGGYRRFVSRVVPLYDERGQLVQWIGTNSDVEERRQAGEALARAQAELAHVARLTTMGELAASLAHELSQPLAALVTNGDACLRWLGRDRPNLDEAMKAVRRVVDDANRASDVIAQTRALLTRSGGDLGGEKTPLDISATIREVLVLVHSEAVRQRTVIEESLAEDLPPVAAVRGLIQQVILNLIVNAIEAMTDVSDRSRELMIRSERHEVDDGPGVLVTVQDAGVGVAAENLARLFEAFYTTKPHGLGMGLSISRSIVQAHGGRLWATRNAGHGMTFQFVLPAGNPPA